MNQYLILSVLPARIISVPVGKWSNVIFRTSAV